jgi:hypothetical protein
MNLVELDGALRKLRLSGMAATLEARLRQAQSEKQTPIDLVSALVGDELLRRQDRLITRRIQQARFRDAERSLDAFDLDFNKKMNSDNIHDLATARFIAHRDLHVVASGLAMAHLLVAERALLHFDDVDLFTGFILLPYWTRTKQPTLFCLVLCLVLSGNVRKVDRRDTDFRNRRLPIAVMATTL